MSNKVKDVDNHNGPSVLLGCPSLTAEAGRSKMCEGCPGQALCQSLGKTDPYQEGIDLRMNAITHKILVVSGKGGVGKSSVAATLSIALSQYFNQKSALLDLDICGPSATKLMSVIGEPVINTEYGWKPLLSPLGNVKVMSVGAIIQSDSCSITFRGPRKAQLIKQFLKDTFWGRLDYLICDTPPGTSDEHLTVISALKNTKPDGVIIVTTPQKVALKTIRKEVTFCQKMGIRILGIVENMSGYACPCCGVVSDIFNSNDGESLCKEYGLEFLGKIPLDQEFVRCCDLGDNVLNRDDNVVAKCFYEIAANLHNLLGST
ncbi:cytosolic Fe-S cluster assembly factor nubp1-like [Tubulanus polymorphus]|uniref:cytosolic Fe-S cluster assembly factor nubp1-like n=1 Tax=Tubulanus polymorphus TaxID=672921 RepID=UPI003DA5CD2B